MRLLQLSVSGADERVSALGLGHAGQGARRSYGKHDYRNLAIARKRDGRQVHDFELPAEDLIIGQLVEPDGLWIGFRIG